MESIWKEAQKLLHKELSQTAMEIWFSDCAVFNMTETTIVLSAPDEFRRDVISSRFTKTLKAVFRELLCSDFEILVLTKEEAEKAEADAPPAETDPFPESGLTFDRFMVGESNLLAYNAAKAIAAGENRNYNPLFLYGNSGLGKTHLLSAVLQEFKRNAPSKRAAYCRSEDFVNRMIEALRERNMNGFRSTLRNVDLLLIDDIEFIAGKESTQEEFYNTFNAIYNAGGSVILTSDRPPRELKTLEDRLRTRFESGILAEITSPEKKLRKEYIRRALTENNIQMEDADIDYLVECLRDNFRQLEGVLKSICAYHDILGKISPSHLEKIISSVAVPENRHLTADRIIDTTSQYFALSSTQVKGLSRERKPSIARQTAMYLCRDLLSMTLIDIGTNFGNRDHATVASAIKKAQANEAKDKQYANIVNDIRMNLRMA